MPRVALTQDQRDRGLELAGKIKARRELRKVTQARLATDSGVPLDTLRALENRRIATPNVFVILDLASALGTTVEDLAT